MEVISWVGRAQYLVLASVYELEAQVVDTLKLIYPFPVYPIGPLIPYFKLGDGLCSSSDEHDLHLNRQHCFRWLDSQPCGAVLYVSFGSMLSVLKSAQMDKIAAGLRDSGVRFLSVARGEASRLKEEVDCRCGLVASWCNQLKVLLHSSIGGFWSHCGWNSTVEGLFSGLPFLTFPVGMDQFPNAKAVMEDWKIGWRVKRGVKTLVTRRNFGRCEKVYGFGKHWGEGNEEKSRRNTGDLPTSNWERWILHMQHPCFY